MRKLIYILLLLVLASCDTEEKFPPAINLVTLPSISPTHQQCLVRYKNTLHDNNVGVTMRTKIVFLTNTGMYDFRERAQELYSSTNKEMAGKMIENLNKHFEIAGINFYLDKLQTSYGNYRIADFDDHKGKFQEYGVITILVYKDKAPAYNGIAGYIPHNVAGVHISQAVGSTVAHEVGHLFGLWHTFTPDSTNGKNATTGDRICDTPSNNIMWEDVDSDNCEYIGGRMYSEEDLKIIIPNYLSYVHQPCRDSFTPVQILAMRWFLEYTPILSAAMF